MKKTINLKKFLIITLIVLLSIAAIGLSIWLICYDGLYLGMKYSDYMTAIDEDIRFDYVGYSFYEKKNGDGMLVHFDLTDDGLPIDEIRYYPKAFRANTKANFEKIEKDMTIYEVVSLVGVPHRSNTSGTLSLVFDADDGTEYCIYFYRTSPQDNTQWLVSKMIELE